MTVSPAARCRAPECPRGKCAIRQGDCCQYSCAGIDLDFEYIGCFADNNEGRDLNGQSLRSLPRGLTVNESAVACAELCAGFDYFGLQWTNQCFCGNE